MARAYARGARARAARARLSPRFEESPTPVARPLMSPGLMNTSWSRPNFRPRGLFRGPETRPRRGGKRSFGRDFSGARKFRPGLEPRTLAVILMFGGERGEDAGAG